MVEDGPRDGLARAATRGAVMTIGGQGARIAIQLVGVVALARLLQPADFGIVAMVLVVVGVAEVVRDFGLTSAAVQAETLTAGQRANLWWLNFGIGIVLTGALLALSYPIAAFYSEPRLVAVSMVLSVVFALGGFSAQYRATLTRTMRLGTLAGIEVAAQAFALGVALWLAIIGWGYWALVAQQVSQALLMAVVLPVLCRWWPTLPRRGEQIRTFISYGGALVASQLLTYLSRNVDTIVIGRVFGARELGFYNRAYQLMALPLNQISAPSTRVALPILSRLNDKPLRYAEFVGFGQLALLNVLAAVLGICVAQAPDLISVVLGPNWTASVPLFQILAVAGLFQATGIAAYWVFLSKALTRRLLTYTLWTRPFAIAIIGLGAFWGVEGVAFGYLITTVLAWPVALLWLRGKTDAPLMRLFLNALRTLGVYATASAVSFGVTAMLPTWPASGRLSLGVAAFFGAVAVIALAYPAFRRDLRAVASARRYLKRDGGVTA